MKEKNLGIIDNELHEIKEQTIKNILGSKRVYYIKYKQKIERGKKDGKRIYRWNNRKWGRMKKKEKKKVIAETISNEIIRDALNSEQYFQLRCNGDSKSKALKEVINEMKQNGVFYQYTKNALGIVNKVLKEGQWK